MTRNTLAMVATVVLVGCRSGDQQDATERITLLQASDGGASADYSLDGRLAFDRIVEGKSAIFVANGDATNARRVTFGVWDFGPRWSPDGKWIAFQRDAGLQSDILIVPADSGAEIVVAASSANDQLQDWLPDGSAILFVRATERGGEPWMYRVADKSATKAFDVDGTLSMAPSPDGKWIAYTLQKGGNSTVWLWDRASNAHRQLTTEGFESVSVDGFSPDSRRILYQSRRTGTGDLWTVDIASGDRRQLTQDVADDFGGLWSPDGRRVAFSSNRGGQPDVWVIATGESDVQRITDDVANDGVVRWTPDGSGVLALVSPGHAHLYSISLSDGVATQLTSGEWDVNGAVVSRDGSRIAYVGTKNGDGDIWVIPAGGGESRLVAGGPGNDGGPDFSPDGKSLAFTSVRSGNPDIWIVSADSGAQPTQLTNWQSIENNPEWAPEGRTIAFLSTRESSGSDLWTVSAAGGTPRRLTRLGTVGASYDWSKDGRTIAFTAEAQGSSGGRVVFTVSATGGAPRQLIPPTSGSPEWSPDGRTIAVTKCTLGYCNVEVRDLGGALLNSLSPPGNNYDFQARWSHDGSQVLVGSQDLATNAANRVFLKPATGGVGRQLTGAYSQALPIGFTAGDRAAIVLGSPYGFETQQIAVSAPVARTP